MSIPNDQNPTETANFATLLNEQLIPEPRFGFARVDGTGQPHPIDYVLLYSLGLGLLDCRLQNKKAH